MSPQAQAVVVACSLVLGFVGGVAGALMLLRFADTALVGWLLGVRQRGGNREHSVIDLEDIDPETLTEADRASVAHEFAAHAEAMQREVGRDADLLAGDDAVLRERLRTFERRGWSA